MPTVAASHITIDDKGVARIDGTRMKVQHVIEAWKTGADTPAKLHQSYPHLSLSQIHAALAYYYDHSAEIDSTIARELEEFEVARAQSAMSPGQRRLREQGRLP